MKRIVDLVWEGITLKHLFYKKIIIPYLLFLGVLILFETYLTVFLLSSIGLLKTLGYQPTLYFWGTSLFLTSATVFSAMVFIETVIDIKNKKGNLI